MRIGLDGFPLLTPRTGVGHYTFELARALARLAPSDEFELVAPGPFPGSIIEDIRRNCPDNLRAVNAEASSIRRRRWWAVGLPLYLRKASLDLFHGTNYEVPLWSKRRSVLTIHDLSILLHPDTHQADLARRARRRLPVMARSASMIITATECVRREICQHLHVKPDRVVVTPYAPRSGFQAMPAEQANQTKRRFGVEDEFILFVGTVEPRKNLLTLVRAFEQVLRQTSRRPQLVVVGAEGWLMDELFAFIKESAISDRLRLTGYLDDDDLRALYSSCTVFVYPSIYEGFGLPPLEAMACGAPVIASNIATFQETLGDVAQLVESNDAEALAKRIVEFLENEDRRRTLSAAGLEHAGKFSWERTARLTLEVYREVLRQI
ncbi:MAG TPA: glycosyltransferase family 1 protein [Pyrinomonadaceae bacterium]|nr:glycosyltransferase family 1 protein [Pyrinomonadaceae bacterium]